MGSSASSGLGGSANHSLQDAGKAEPDKEVNRPIASQGTEINRRSLFELPVMQNPHTTRVKESFCKRMDGKTFVMVY